MNPRGRHDLVIQSQPMSTYLITFHPLCETPIGRSAIKRHRFKPYEDGSCRREPDFNSRYPSITSLCRGTRFVRNLKPDDLVLYITVLGKWDIGQECHWRVVALLRVIDTQPSHEEAASWYRARGLPPPSNCFIPQVKRLRLSMTAGAPRNIVKDFSPPQYLAKWDLGYEVRVRRTPKFVITEAEFLCLAQPPRVTRSMWNTVFNGVLNTQSAQKVEERRMRRLLRLAKASAA